MRKSVKYKGVDVVYSQIGSGRTIVLLHGFLEDRSMWNDYALKLSSEFSVISVDLLGQGDSGNIGYVHTMEEHASAVAAVLDAEKIDACVVVGHSMGGYVVLSLAKSRPELVEGFVLFQSTAFPDSPEKRQDRERTMGLVKRNKDVYVRMAIPSLVSEGKRNLLKDEIEELIQTASAFTEQGIVANIQGMMVRPDRTRVLEEASCRKLIIHGELDTVIPVQDAEAMAKLADDIQLQVVHGIGHMGHLEAPEKCLGLIMDFCKN